MVSTLYRNFQYKYADTDKEVLFHEEKGVDKGFSQMMVIWLPWPCAGSLCSLHPPLLPRVESPNSVPSGQAAPQP